MVRWLSSILLVLSLLLCITAAGLWVHSYFTGDSLNWAVERMKGHRFEYRNLAVNSVRGGVWFSYGYYGRELSAAERARKERRDAITYRDAVRRHEQLKGILETGRGRMSEPGAALANVLAMIIFACSTAFDGRSRNCVRLRN